MGNTKQKLHAEYFPVSLWGLRGLAVVVEGEQGGKLIKLPCCHTPIWPTCVIRVDERSRKFLKPGISLTERGLIEALGKTGVLPQMFRGSLICQQVRQIKP